MCGWWHRLPNKVIRSAKMPVGGFKKTPRVSSSSERPYRGTPKAFQSYFVRRSVHGSRPDYRRLISGLSFDETLQSNTISTYATRAENYLQPALERQRLPISALALRYPALQE
jgi:hypothetical protein